MELDTLRVQTQTLLSQLQNQQSTVKSQLGTLFAGNARSSSGIRQHAKTPLYDDVRITTASPVNFAYNPANERTSPKIHLYRKVDSHGYHPTNPNSREHSNSSSADLTLEGANLREPNAREEAMQTILKRRKIIDDNIKVGPAPQPQYVHTMNGRRNLNFDYSDTDDIDVLKKVVRNQLEIDMALEDSVTPRQADVEDLARRRQLSDSGNDRQHSAIIRELSSRPKSIVFDESASQGREQFGISRSHIADMTSQRGGERPLLGYDFIAGLLDNESQLVDRSDAYYDELNEFRRVNKEECVGKSRIESILDLTRPISPEVRDPGHTCIHGYSINDRLYPEPLNEDKDGRSMCPVCLVTRHTPTQEDPAYVRVSIPRSTLLAPYRVKPHRRRSFDDTDNFALSKHCLAGWECSKPSMLPTASTVDLKQAADGLRARLTTTVQDIEAITASYKKIPAPPESLLDASRALRAEVQFNAMSMSHTNPLHSTAY